MAEGVALVRAAEKSKAVYMLAENYPYMLFNREMHRLYRGGTLGKLIFAEGEYNHPFAPAEDLGYYISLAPHSKHWRYDLPRSYYITHALAPLMYITGALPKRVTAFASLDPVPEEKDKIQRGVPERAAIILTQNNDGSVFRVTGCAAFGHHESSYRICGTKGQMENLRDRSDRVLLSYNGWDKPDEGENSRIYKPELVDDDKELIEKAGHGGGDFFVAREFLDCIREGRQPEFDVYFATAMASAAILGHRSLLEDGKPYDIPDFRKEEDRVKYENDRISPFYGTDGSEPTIAPSTNMDHYPLTEEGKKAYDARIENYKKTGKIDLPN
jgi:predicted dehydrogenase